MFSHFLIAKFDHRDCLVSSVHTHNTHYCTVDFTW